MLNTCLYILLNTPWFVQKVSFGAKQCVGSIDIDFGKCSFYEKSDNSRLKTFFWGINCTIDFQSTTT